MDLQTEITRIKELLDKATDVAVVTHENPSFDSFGSSLGLYLGLASLGKKVTIACPDPVTVELSNFVGVDKVIRQLGKKNFIISLDYTDGSIEKVSYNIEGDKFNLVVEHRPGFEPFNPDKVHYNYDGGAAQLIFVVDTVHLGGLKGIYEEDKSLFAEKTLVNIDHHPNNTNFGQINLVDPSSSATAEIVANLLSDLGVSLTADIATNILNAIYGATNSFQSPNVAASAFEVAAACLKAGGRRFAAPAPVAAAGFRPLPRIPQMPPVVANPPGAAGQAPTDWLKPKIFKSSKLV